ncbi:hypothetical protein R3P38DRAFT_1704679 [Favolaschia claudopus]|uniref:Uncharacterized protein n=1 Tax=Favolaschia claudopus TaxID=2862362 RepID=A0AAW0ACJ5_9AGAR
MARPDSSQLAGTPPGSSYFLYPTISQTTSHLPPSFRTYSANPASNVRPISLRLPDMVYIIRLWGLGHGIYNTSRTQNEDIGRNREVGRMSSGGAVGCTVNPMGGEDADIRTDTGKCDVPIQSALRVHRCVSSGHAATHHRQCQSPSASALSTDTFSLLLSATQPWRKILSAPPTVSPRDILIPPLRVLDLDAPLARIPPGPKGEYMAARRGMLRYC